MTKKQNGKKTYEAFRSGWERLNAAAEFQAKAAAMRLAGSVVYLQHYLKSADFEKKLDELLERNELIKFKLDGLKNGQRSERILEKIRTLTAEYGKQVMIAGQLGASIGTPFGPGVAVYLGTGLAGIQLVFIIGEVVYVLVMSPEKKLAQAKSKPVSV